jgi:gamma-glutamylaminecyclotransferase
LRIEGKEEKKILKKERDRENTGIKTENNSETTLIFTHRTLKRSFSNHVLMQDLIKTRDAGFNGIYKNAQGSLRRGCHVWGGGVLLAVEHMSYAIEFEIVFTCYLYLQFCILHPHPHPHRFDFKRPKPTTSFPGCVYTKKQRGRVSVGFVRVARVPG